MPGLIYKLGLKKSCNKIKALACNQVYMVDSHPTCFIFSMWDEAFTCHMANNATSQIYW